MRQGNWELVVTVRGQPLPEHDIDGRVCICSQPGEAFKLQVRYHGSEGIFMHKVFVDDMDVSGLCHRIDADGVMTSSRGTPKLSKVFSGWEKSEGGQIATRAFVFEKATAMDGKGEERPATVDWSRGHITLRAYEAEQYVAKRDKVGSAGKSEFSGGAARLDERTMVKSGLSTTAGAGAVSFKSAGRQRAGDVRIRRTKSARVLTEMKVFYRDSFFMSIREQSCCGGRCARMRAQQAAASSAASSSPSDGRSSQQPASSPASSSHQTAVPPSAAGVSAGKRSRDQLAGIAIDLTLSDDEAALSAAAIGGAAAAQKFCIVRGPACGKMPLAARFCPKCGGDQFAID